MTTVAPQPTPTPRQWWTVHWSEWTPQEWQAYYAWAAVRAQYEHARQQSVRHQTTVNALLAIFLWIPMGVGVLLLLMFALNQF